MKKPKNKLLAPRYTLLGHSITSVLRRLGKAGITARHAEAIMARKRIDVSFTTCQINIVKGRSVRCEWPLAPLTDQQVASLVKSAKDPGPKRQWGKENGCACGKPAVGRNSAGPYCAKCRDIERRMGGRK